MRLLIALLLLAWPARAAEVTVLTAGAFKQAVLAAAPAFRARTGDSIKLDNATAGVLQARILSGEAFDVAFLPPAVAAALTAKGHLAPGSTRELARTGVGVVVAAGQPIPDIATVASLRQALLAAPSVAYIDPASGGSSGAYVAALMDRLGIGAQVAAKARLIPGGLVAQHVVDGAAALGIHQISEILAVRGAVLVGPLPAEIQSYTIYAGALSATAAQAQSGQALLDLLAGPAGQAAIRQAGLEPQTSTP